MSSLPCVYDCAAAPLSFDFANFLAISVCVAKTNNFSSIDAIIDATTFRRLGGIESSFDEEYQKRKAHTIFIELPGLSRFVSSVHFGCLRDVPLGVSCFPNKDPVSGRYPSPYYFKQVETLYADTQFDFSSLFSPEQYLQDFFRRALTSRGFNPEKTVCFHLRDSSYNTSRNPPRETFSVLKTLIEASGYQVIGVPDVDSVLQRFDTQERVADWLLPCSFSVQKRFALASVCAMNVTWGGGFCHPFWYSRIPFVTFGIHDSACSITRLDKYERTGPTPFKSLPWFGANQIWDWTDRGCLVPEKMAQLVLDR